MLKQAFRYLFIHTMFRPGKYEIIVELYDSRGTKTNEACISTGSSAWVELCEAVMYSWLRLPGEPYDAYMSEGLSDIATN